MDEDIKDPVDLESWIPNKRGWHSQIADSLAIGKLAPPESLDDLVNVCGAVRLSIQKTSSAVDPNPMLTASVMQLYRSAIELAPTASHPSVPNQESLQTQSQMLNAVNNLVAWCETVKEPASSGKDNRSTCNQQMAETLLANPECVNWSRYEWHQRTGFSESTIQDTKTWEQIKTMRTAEKFERAQPADRRRNRRRPTKTGE